LDLKTTIKALKEDLKHLAGALHQLSTGAELGNVLKGLPPTLLQVGGEWRKCCWQPRSCCCTGWHGLFLGLFCRLSTTESLCLVHDALLPWCAMWETWNTM
jgi:hypothetical protein